MLSQDLGRGVVLAANQSVWQAALQPWLDAEALKLTVLGGSVASGHGSCIADQATAKEGYRCGLDTSWVRLLQDYMDAALLPHRLALTTHVWAQNAVGPQFFQQCVGNKVAGSNVIVLDFMPQAQVAEGSVKLAALHLTELLRRIRLVAPAAAIVYVGWPVHRARNAADAVEASLRSIAQSDRGLDLYLASAPLARIHFNAIADHVHPNSHGSQILAQGVSQLLLHRFRSALCRTGTHPTRQRSGLAGRASTTAAVAEGSRRFQPAPAGASSLEWCSRSAAELPRATKKAATRWALVNEAVEGDLPKLGFLSSRAAGETWRASDPLQLGPLAPRARCALLVATLGYLQSWRPNQGQLDVSCVGCQCLSAPGIWGRSWQFPHIDTYSSTANATLTMYTSFLVAKKEADCYVSLTHSPPQRNGSRVRVDSLGLEVASCGWSCFALHRHTWPPIQAFGVHVRRVAVLRTHRGGVRCRRPCW